MVPPTNSNSPGGSDQTSPETKWREFAAQVSSALRGENPWEDARTVYGELHLSSGAARNQFFSTLLEHERRAFKHFVDTQECSQELRGCLAHRGELFKEPPPAELPRALQMDWLDLAIDELSFVVKHPRWDDYAPHIALHALEVIHALVPARVEQTQLSNGEEIPAVLQSLFQCEPFIECVTRGDTQEEVQLIDKAVAVGRSLNDCWVNDEIEALLPTFWETCTSLYQCLYLRPSSLYGEAFLATETDVAAMLSGDFPASADRNAEDYSNSGAALEGGDADDIHGVETPALLDLWRSVIVTALEVALENGMRDPLPGRAELFSVLLNEAPIEMPGYSLALRALATESLSELSEFLTAFLSEGLHSVGATEVLGDLLCAMPQTPPARREEVRDLLRSHIVEMSGSDCALLRQHLEQRQIDPSDKSWLRSFLSELDRRIDTFVPSEKRVLDWAFSFENILEAGALRKEAYGTALDGISGTHPLNLAQVAGAIVSAACSQRVGALVLISALAAHEAGDERMGPVTHALSPLLRNLTPAKKAAVLEGAESLLARSQVVFAGASVRDRIMSRLLTELELEWDCT